MDLSMVDGGSAEASCASRICFCSASYPSLKDPSNRKSGLRTLRRHKSFLAENERRIVFIWPRFFGFRVFMYQWLNAPLTADIENPPNHHARPTGDSFPAGFTTRVFVGLCKAIHSVSPLGHCPQVPAGLSCQGCVTSESRQCSGVVRAGLNYQDFGRKFE